MQHLIKFCYNIKHLVSNFVDTNSNSIMRALCEIKLTVLKQIYAYVNICSLEFIEICRLALKYLLLIIHHLCMFKSVISLLK